MRESVGRPGCHLIGGTSGAAPELAGIVATATQAREDTVVGCPALAGYDLASGVGMLDASKSIRRWLTPRTSDRICRVASGSGVLLPRSRRGGEL